MSRINLKFITNLFVVLFLCTSTAFARKAIQITLNNGTPSSTAEFTNLSDAIESLKVNPSATYGVGYVLGGNFNGTIDVLGFQISLGFSGNSVSYGFLDRDGVLVTRTFTGATPVEALDLLEDFFASDAGAEDFKKYLDSLQANAMYNFVTGPDSTVGQSVRENTLRAMGPTLTRLEQRKATRQGGHFSIGFQQNSFDSGEFSGKTYLVPIEAGGQITQNIGLLFRLPLGYTDLEGTEFYRLGMELDLPISMLGKAPAAKFAWEVTPTVGNYFQGTADLLVGGDVYNYGLQNRFQFNSGPFSFSYGVYYGQYKSAKVSLGDIDVDLNVDDVILSQGLKAIYRVGGNVVIDFFVMNSSPEDGDNFKEVETIGGSLNFRAGPATLRLGYEEDEGKDKANETYEAERLTASLIFRF